MGGGGGTVTLRHNQRPRDWRPRLPRRFWTAAPTNTGHWWNHLKMTGTTFSFIFQERPFLGWSCAWSWDPPEATCRRKIQPEKEFMTHCPGLTSFLAPLLKGWSLQSTFQMREGLFSLCILPFLLPYSPCWREVRTLLEESVHTDDSPILHTQHHHECCTKAHLRVWRALQMGPCEDLYKQPFSHVQRIWNRLTQWMRTCALGHFSQRNGSLFGCRNLYVSAHGSFVHTSSTQETVQVSFKVQVVNQTVVHVCQSVRRGNRKKQTAIVHDNGCTLGKVMEWRTPISKEISYMVSFF